MTRTDARVVPGIVRSIQPAPEPVDMSATADDILDDILDADRRGELYPLYLRLRDLAPERRLINQCHRPASTTANVVARTNARTCSSLEEAVAARTTTNQKPYGTRTTDRASTTRR